MVRFGILGIGNMGSTHADYLFNGDIKDACLAAVCDLKQERLNWAKEKFGDKVKRYTDAEEMYRSGEIDAVIVAVPHYDHPKYTMLGFECGLHVICEKPAGVYTKQVKEMNAAAEKSGKIFSMMFNQRTNPVYRKIKEMISNGELGQLKRVVWIITDWYRTQSYYNSGGWRATWAGEGGGVLLNQCPHNIDLWQWMCGMPKRVRSFLNFGKRHDIEVEDDVTTYVEYENGATGVFITTTGDAPGTNRLEITGEMGKIIVDGRSDFKFYKNEISDIEFCKTASEPFGAPKCEVIDLSTDEKEPAHRGITQNFVNAILYGEKLIASGTEGINGLTFSNAMHLSAFTNDWVEIPFDDEVYYQKLMEKVKTSKAKENVVERTTDTTGTY